MRTHCLKQAEKVKNFLQPRRSSLQPNSSPNNPQPRVSQPNIEVPSQPTETAFLLVPEDEEAHLDFKGFDKMFSYKIEKPRDMSDIKEKGDRLPTKREMGEVWFKIEKNVQYLMNTSTKDLKNARSCALNKQPHNAYYLLSKIAARLGKRIK